MQQKCKCKWYEGKGDIPLLNQAPHNEDVSVA